MKTILFSAALMLAATHAHAHASFEVAEASQNANYKAVVRIGHDCEGTPTHTVRIVVPEGVIAAKPMPKAGWTVTTEVGDYARTYDYFGKPMAKGVKTIIWSGGKLGDDQYDEFVFQARMTDQLPAGEKLYVPVTQVCEKGEHAWTEIPAKGQDAHALKFPAPAILIKAAPQKVAQAGHAGGHGHHGAPAASTAGGLKLSPAWTRATPPGAKVAGGFLTIENTAQAADRLIGGSFEASKIFEVHEMAMDGGVMKMRALEKGLPIAPGAKVELKPGGYHVMFIDLTRPIKEGETLKGELHFEKAGKVPVEFKAMAIGARGTDAGHSHH